MRSYFSRTNPYGRKYFNMKKRKFENHAAFAENRRPAASAETPFSHSLQPWFESSPSVPSPISPSSSFFPFAHRPRLPPPPSLLSPPRQLAPAWQAVVAGVTGGHRRRGNAGLPVASSIRTLTALAAQRPPARSLAPPRRLPPRSRRGELHSGPNSLSLQQPPVPRSPDLARPGLHRRRGIRVPPSVAFAAAAGIPAGTPPVALEPDPRTGGGAYHARFISLRPSCLGCCAGRAGTGACLAPTPSAASLS
jgi:hypothetical protein